MTYPDISKAFGITIKTDATKLKLINKACPDVVLRARERCGRYLGVDPEYLEQQRIKDYVITMYNYDAIDVSRIVELYKQEGDMYERPAGV
jgi:hypothetical protein